MNRLVTLARHLPTSDGRRAKPRTARGDPLIEAGVDPQDRRADDPPSNWSTFSSEIRQLDLRRRFTTQKVTHLNSALWWDHLVSAGLA
jgi:hypothetical protein